jgi:hypothetical protein
LTCLPRSTGNIGKKQNAAHGPHFRFPGQNPVLAACRLDIGKLPWHIPAAPDKLAPSNILTILVIRAETICPRLKNPASPWIFGALAAKMTTKSGTQAPHSKRRYLARLPQSLS